MTVTQMKATAIRMGMTLECSPRPSMRMTLILAMTKRVMVVVTPVIIIMKITQTRAIMMKRNLAPLDLKTLF